MPPARDRATGRFTKSEKPYGVYDGNGDVTINEETFYGLITNAILRRWDLTRGTSFDDRRDINDECGYIPTERLTIKNYKDMYDREAIAARVVEILPNECWAVDPTVFEDEDSDNVTDFEARFSEIGKGLFGYKSWYQDDEYNPIWEYMNRMDVLCGIGWFGVMLLGVDDGGALNEPIESVERAVLTNNQDVPKNTGDRNLLFVRVFDESLVQVERYEMDETNPMYGRPTMYNVSFEDPAQPPHGSSMPNTTSKQVHWTRILHCNDALGSSELYSYPRQQQVWNRLYDLRKMYAGCAEMFWRGAFPGISLETHPQLGGNVKIDRDLTRTQMEQYMNGLQRYMLNKGMTARSLAPQVADPSNHIDVLITAICIRKGIPKRVFMGSERGELASGQDKRTWNDRVMFRQNRLLTPRRIIPLVDRLIHMQVLPEPKGFSVGWPDLNSLSDTEVAEVAIKRTEAMTKYVAGSVESIMVPMDFLTRVLGFTQEEAESIVEAAVDVMPDDKMTLVTPEEQDQDTEDEDTQDEGNQDQDGGQQQEEEDQDA